MSEFRQDPISGDWVIITPERSKRPSELSPKHPKRVPAPKNKCPFEFEHLAKSDQWPPLLRSPQWRASQGGPLDARDIKKLKLVVVRNKYPLVSPANTCESIDEGVLYHAKKGGGIHNLIITRDHVKNFADLKPADAEEVMAVFQEQYRSMRMNSCARYISGFFNWGHLAGASVWHPHYQIASLPVLPPHVARSLAGANAYFEKHGRCVRCDVIKAEREKKVRIVAENKNAIAFTRFASKTPFEVNIMPKAHASFFEKTSPAVMRDIVALMQFVMRRLKLKLNDPDLNFFIHSAPVDGQLYEYHHWHVELIPKLTTPAGLEFSTEIYANVVDPDQAAKILRK